MNRETAPRTKPHCVARSRSHRLSAPARRTPRNRLNLLLAADLRVRRGLAVGSGHLAGEGELHLALLRERVGRLHLLAHPHPLARPDELSALPPLRAARREG